MESRRIFFKECADKAHDILEELFAEHSIDIPKEPSYGNSVHSEIEIPWIFKYIKDADSAFYTRLFQLTNNCGKYANASEVDYAVMNNRMPEIDIAVNAIAFQYLFGSRWVEIIFIFEDEKDRDLASVVKGGENITEGRPLLICIVNSIYAENRLKRYRSNGHSIGTNGNGSNLLTSPLFSAKRIAYAYELHDGSIRVTREKGYAELVADLTRVLA